MSQTVDATFTGGVLRAADDLEDDQLRIVREEGYSHAHCFKAICLCE
jgi:hypothetical protein